MKVTKEIIDYVFSERPESVGSNTRFIIAFYETACDIRGIDKSWENIKALMMEYKPENVTRKRREFIDSTKEQREKEQEYHEEYRNNNPSVG